MVIRLDLRTGEADWMDGARMECPHLILVEQKNEPCVVDGLSVLSLQ